MTNKRVYSSRMPDAPTLEIQRSNLSSVVLQLKSLGFQDVLGVEFLDRPPQTALLASLKQLFLLGALSHDGEITSLGRQMVALPLDPVYAK